MESSKEDICTCDRLGVCIIIRKQQKEVTALPQHSILYALAHKVTITFIPFDLSNARLRSSA
jgi:hypothetical protein